MKPQQSLNRRKFLKRTAASVAGSLVVPTIIPASALGRGGAVAPSDRIVMGAIGIGGMGRANMNGFLPRKEVQMVAVCDLDQRHANIGAQMINKRYDNKEARQYHYYQEFLAKEKLDAVTIALPDHWHGIVYSAAANAGLDIYGEKPLARTIREGRAIADAVSKNKVVWQTGSWQRSRPNFHRACELVRNGVIGKVKYVEVGLPDGHPLIGTPPVKAVPEGVDWDLWLGPAQKVPYRGVLHFHWRWILDYSGGQLTDWCGHHVDIAHWGLNKDKEGPVEVEGKGVYPHEGIYNVPVEYDFKCTYADGVVMRVANQSRLKHGMGTCWYGENGWIHVDRGNRLNASDPELLKMELGNNAKPLYLSRDHYQNFLECIRSRKETITPVETAHRSISVGLLGEIAMLTGEKLKWDPKKEEFLNSDYANRLLFRPFREPYKMP